eukprot:TRINITY_DN1109_c0_g1_i1.p1 TRINITY_DN1109_c0_g1~~TRINITY_DN1109_c0_g1_i1.p1  ORF type:complete len:544 (-),score=95.97 TRINITY_DN1109_c0_g1_i1:392-2023(-)
MKTMLHARLVLGVFLARPEAANPSLNDRVAELERLVLKQQELLSSQEEQFQETQHMLSDISRAAAEPRRLAATTLPPKVHVIDNTTERAFTDIENLQQALDHTWFILCGAMVMFMQAGFAMVESGCCRAKNVQNILLKNLTDVCVGTLGWWMSGWAFAYGGPMVDGYLENGFIGTDQFFGAGFMSTPKAGMIEPTGAIKSWFFQWAFCGAAATIVSGGVAERVNFPGYCIFSFVMTAFIYPVCVAWTWGYGFLAKDISDVGYMDFAGSGVVHMTGGVGALVGAIIAGPRMGRFDNPDAFNPHSLPLIVLGTFILWFGWYGFNCGSTLGMTTAAKGMMAAQVAMNTTIAGATGGLTVFTLRLALLKKYDIGGFCNGILAGLVSITAPCGNVEVGPAFVIALIGGFLYQGASALLRKVKVDDPIDAFAVHGVCGAWGTLAAALFDWGDGFDLYHGWSGFACAQDASGVCLKGAWGGGMAANVVEVLAIASWVAAWSTIIFLPLRLANFLRASDSVQQEGFDAAKHSPSKAYAMGEPGAGSCVISA